MNSWHEVPNLVSILYFASFFLLPLSLSSFLDFSPCSPSLLTFLVLRPPSCPSCPRFAFRYLLFHFVRHFYAPFCLFHVAKTTSTSATSHRTHAPHPNHSVLLPCLEDDLRRPTPSHAVPRILLLAFPWVYDTFSFVVESFRGRTDGLRCCLSCCFIQLSVGGDFLLKIEEYL